MISGSSVNCSLSVLIMTRVTGRVMETLSSPAYHRPTIALTKAMPTSTKNPGLRSTLSTSKRVSATSGPQPSEFVSAAGRGIGPAAVGRTDCVSTASAALAFDTLVSAGLSWRNERHVSASSASEIAIHSARFINRGPRNGGSTVLRSFGDQCSVECRKAASPNGSSSDIMSRNSGRARYTAASRYIMSTTSATTYVVSIERVIVDSAKNEAASTNIVGTHITKNAQR